MLKHLGWLIDPAWFSAQSEWMVSTHNEKHWYFHGRPKYATMDSYEYKSLLSASDSNFLLTPSKKTFRNASCSEWYSVLSTLELTVWEDPVFFKVKTGGYWNGTVYHTIAKLDNKSSESLHFCTRTSYHQSGKNLYRIATFGTCVAAFKSDNLHEKMQKMLWPSLKENKSWQIY